MAPSTSRLSYTLLWTEEKFRLRKWELQLLTHEIVGEEHDCLYLVHQGTLNSLLFGIQGYYSGEVGN
jgi:hypothetical protein